MTIKQSLILTICLFLPLPSPASIGIAMRFVDVTMEYVEPGASFNLRVARNLPLVVINQDTDAPADIMIEAVAPKEKEMKDGYEPVPDPSWVTAVPSHFTLGPKASASSDISITIPNDPKLIGHNYEVIVWVHTDHKNKASDASGVVIQAGLRSRFRLSIGVAGPEALQREKRLKKLETINANFSLNPDNLYAQKIALGKDVDLKADQRLSFKVVNQADDPVDLKFKSSPADPNIFPESGYVNTPNPAWITLSPSDISLQGNSIKEIKVHLNIPDRPENHGKKWMFLIQTTLKDDSLPLLYNNMLYVTTQN